MIQRVGKIIHFQVVPWSESSESLFLLTETGEMWEKFTTTSPMACRGWTKVPLPERGDPDE